MVWGRDICTAAIAPVTGLILKYLCRECAPVRWDDQNRWIVYEYAEAAPVCVLWEDKGRLIGNKIEAGDINCRYSVMLERETTGDRCVALAKAAHISRSSDILKLNPDLHGDCANIKYNTGYCVEGFIEPLRAYDGKCGPPHKNATCRGVNAGQCCNSETWTCGDSYDDCAPGTCYEGICFGHKWYTTDGLCGENHNESRCRGKWGDCCSIDGKCGSGADFCSKSRCYSGKCDGLKDPEPGHENDWIYLIMNERRKYESY
ncbi:hypothetical protein VHEMI09292 [[Torrubiella] hemipterigena]|uniref:Chitin-binding type-1 domain-containing protein n=1 Tax=[Torrubiella] hemipterigena TaxID=1531966 RepID=A0A0A1T9J2_9HYPO|nr:hypothetical protein VHEMI09292 [[Torrubiella] hemipterigena]